MTRQTGRLWSALKRRSDFLAVRAGGRAHGTDFIVQIFQRPTETTLGRIPISPEAVRIGFTVTKKTGNAVERNRIKRRLRAACDTLSFPAAIIGCDCVIVARRSVLTLPFDVLVERLNESMIRALTPHVAKSKRSRQKA